MWAAIFDILLAIGMLEEAHAKGIKPDWPKTFALAAWIVVFTAIACAALLWGVQEKRDLWGLAGFAAVEAAGIAAGLLIARQWTLHEIAKKKAAAQQTSGSC